MEGNKGTSSVMTKSQQNASTMQQTLEEKTKRQEKIKENEDKMKDLH